MDTVVCRQLLFHRIQNFFLFPLRLGIASVLNDFSICRRDTLHPIYAEAECLLTIIVWLDADFELIKNIL